MNLKVRHNQQLLLEGKDDMHVVLALCSKFSVDENFDIIDCGGNTELIKEIPVRLKQSNIKTIGIVIDADSHLKQRWESTKKALENMSFEVPEHIPENGLIAQNATTKVRIGVWVMPNNRANGMLEDFIEFLVPDNDKLLPIVHSTLEDIERKDLNAYNVIHRSKAVIHTWLSWQEDPGSPMGQAITKKYLDTDRETCLTFVNWLKLLFAADKG